ALHARALRRLYAPLQSMGGDDRPGAVPGADPPGSFRALAPRTTVPGRDAVLLPAAADSFRRGLRPVRPNPRQAGTPNVDARAPGVLQPVRRAVPGSRPADGVRQPGAAGLRPSRRPLEPPRPR